MQIVSFLILLSLVSAKALALTELGPATGLDPMTGPGNRNVGWEWHYVDQDGNPGFMRKVAGDDKVASYVRTDGCNWTRSTHGFAPASNWHGCPSSGSSTVEFLGGAIWPLVVGNKFEYRVKGTSSLIGRAWRSKRSCEVVAMVKVVITSGLYNAFKVDCKERWGSRTWWLSPEVGTAVAYRQKTRRGGVVLQEMTKIVSP